MLKTDESSIEMKYDEIRVKMTNGVPTFSILHQGKELAWLSDHRVLLEGDVFRVTNLEGVMKFTTTDI